MSPIQYGKPGGDARGWTWEHVIPRSRTPRGMHGLKLLACAACNSAKGAAAPDDAHVALALKLSREWFARHNQHGVTTELERLAYPNNAARQAADAFYDVPESVEEALAQGGIQVVRQATAARLGVTDARYLPGAKRGGRRGAPLRFVGNWPNVERIA